MQVPVQVTFHHIDTSAALEEAIRERASKLDRYHPNVLSCRVVVTGQTKRHQQGNQFSLRLDVRVKGQEFAITRMGNSEDPFVAVRNAFEAAQRQIEEHARTQRGEIKTHAR